MVINLFLKKLSLLLIILIGNSAFAQMNDPFDPFSIPDTSEENDKTTIADEEKSVLQLIFEASQLFAEDRPLDARTKLLIALKKDPKQYRIHMMLSGYYMQHVGHFRLALRYARQAESLLFEKRGTPPYSEPFIQGDHQQILYLIAQARLNLDDYQGSLESLDYFASLGYQDEWYAGTKSWVLMKLGRLDDAIVEARSAVSSGIDDGRTLNMLGILLSMKGEREQSLRVFKEAIAYELALGREGQPATPLNNQGEVFKELFQDERAESSWKRATSMPDGCEHVLPSLNMAMMLLDQLRAKEAAQVMDNFESCVAQFPLRNGEEHRALVQLIRGRVALLNGDAESAIRNLEGSIESRQWFGKIGTDQEDLEAGALISLSRALLARINIARANPLRSNWEALGSNLTELGERIRAWWLERKALQLLVEQLGDFEDFTIRHTDSLLEYPYLGRTLTDIPSSVLLKKYEEEKANDNRVLAELYYRSFIAHSDAAHGSKAEAINQAQAVIQGARADLDRALILDAHLLVASLVSEHSPDYIRSITAAFKLNPPSIRNSGLSLPVRLLVGEGLSAQSLSGSPFHESDTQDEFAIVANSRDSEVSLEFIAKSSYLRENAKAPSFELALAALADKIFTKDLKKRNPK